MRESSDFLQTRNGPLARDMKSKKQKMQQTRKESGRWRARMGRTNNPEAMYFWYQEARSGVREPASYQVDVLGEV